MSFSDRPPRLEDWLRGELRRPLSSSERARRRVMDRIRAEARGAGTTRGDGGPKSLLPPARSRLYGLALAAGVSGIIAVDAARPFTGGAELDRAESRLVDTVAGALADTLRVVRFMLVAPAAGHVALVGDFNRWDPRATPLRRVEDAWSTSLPLVSGRHRYAFVVDDTQWIADPSASQTVSIDGRRASVLELGEPRE